MEAIDLSRVRLMLVEHEPNMLTLFKSMLKTFSCERIIAATDANDAFQQITRELPPDAIIAEYAIPPVNGIEFVRRVRTDPESPNRFVPIILTSGKWEWTQIEEARDAGVNEVLLKPFSPKALGERVYAVISRPRPFVEIDGYFGPDRRRREKRFEGSERRKKQVPLVEADSAPAAPEDEPTQESIDKFLES